MIKEIWTGEKVKLGAKKYVDGTWQPVITWPNGFAQAVSCQPVPTKKKAVEMCEAELELRRTERIGG